MSSFKDVLILLIQNISGAKERVGQIERVALNIHYHV